MKKYKVNRRICLVVEVGSIVNVSDEQYERAKDYLTEEGAVESAPSLPVKRGRTKKGE